MKFIDIITKNLHQLSEEDIKQMLNSLKTDFRKCSCCGEFKSLDDFHSKKSRTNKCKECIREKNKKYYQLRKSKK